MSPLTLIKLFLGSVFKRKGFEEKEHFSVAKEGGAREVKVRNGFAKSCH